MFYLNDLLVQGLVLETERDGTTIVFVQQRQAIYALVPDGTVGVLFTKTDEKHSWFAPVNSITAEQYANESWFVLTKFKWRYFEEK